MALVEGWYFYCTKKYFALVNGCGNNYDSLKIVKNQNFLENVVPFHKPGHKCEHNGSIWDTDTTLDTYITIEPQEAPSLANSVKHCDSAGII